MIAASKHVGRSAIVVGSGPNGLAAAITLARQGVQVTVLEAADRPGGGARSSELTLPGVLHDECSSTHPMGVGAPFMKSLTADCPADKQVEWLWPEIDLAHPLDSGSAGLMRKSLDETVDGLGIDGDSWRKLFGPLSRDFDTLAEELLGPVAHLPKHPLKLMRFGARALLPASVLARRWKTPEAKALYAGVAAHLFHPLTSPASASLGLMMVAAGHRYGWPVARGGSQAITDAMVATLEALGGKVETGVHVSNINEVTADIVMLDTAPAAAAGILGDRLKPKVRRAYRRYEHGPAAFKVDFAVQGGIPWRNDDCHKAGCLHLGGEISEVIQTEREINRGRMPERPFVLVGQQYVADPSRSNGDIHPIWAYAHVPHGYPGDATEAIIKQLERFAPGVRERIVATSTRSTRQLQDYNANYVGGDIITGANTPYQLVMRPRLSLNPYSTTVPGVYICSAATPPGAGVHGMCGFNAAKSALKTLKG